MNPPDLLTQVVSRADSVRVRNVINPLLWLSAVTLPSGIGGAWLFHEQPLFAAPLLATGLAVPLGAMVAYFYFMLRDPSRLHSEEFLIEHQRLLLEQKGVAAPSEVDALALSRNPRIEGGRKASQVEGEGE